MSLRYVVAFPRNTADGRYVSYSKAYPDTSGQINIGVFDDGSPEGTREGDKVVIERNEKMHS